MKYRPEIDGLRAIAVLSVLIYHAKFKFGGFPVLSGGFLGVDIFFVISGYLITSIILREIEQGKFSFTGFYERRARRILPALFLVMLVSIPFAWDLLLPGALQEYSLSVLSSLGFISNVLFWLQDSYTAAPSELKPFLHTWSLSVEEQFYVLFPIILMMVSRFFPGRVLVTIVVLLISSLALAQIGNSHFSDANFFLLPSRCWELMAGALLARLEAKNNALLRYLSHPIVPKLALATIVLALILFDESTAHPSVLTALPVFATVALIAHRNIAELVTRILSNRMMVSVGLISYSLYLWHFPIFAFARVRGELISTEDKLLFIAASLIVATAAYYFVEKPLRNKARWKPKTLMTVLLLVFILLSAIQSYFYLSGGAAQRLGSVEELFAVAAPETILNGDQNTDKDSVRLVNVGDSHAGVFASSVLALASKYGANFTHMEQSGCPLVPGVYRFDDGKFMPRCSGLQAQWINQVNSYRDSIIIYSARFNLYFDGERFNNGEGGVEPGYTVLLTGKKSGEPDAKTLKALVQSTIKSILDNGNKVVLIYPIPEVGWHLPKHIKAKLAGAAADKKLSEFERISIKTPYKRYRDRSRNTFEMYDAIGEHENLLRVYPSNFLCSEEYCYAHDKTRLFYYDDNHLTTYAADKIIEDMEQAFIRKNWFK